MLIVTFTHKNNVLLIIVLVSGGAGRLPALTRLMSAISIEVNTNCILFYANCGSLFGDRIAARGWC